jgi:hypothetical protein
VTLDNLSKDITTTTYHPCRNISVYRQSRLPVMASVLKI